MSVSKSILDQIAEAQMKLAHPAMVASDKAIFDMRGVSTYIDPSQPIYPKPPCTPRTTVIDICVERGWKQDHRSMSMLSPSGKRYPLDMLEHMTPSRINEVITMDLDRWLKEMASTTPPPTYRWNANEKLRMRLNMQAGENWPIDHVHIWEGSNVVHVFLVHKDSALMIEDEKAMFPSDALITKLRLTFNSFTS